MTRATEAPSPRVPADAASTRRRNLLFGFCLIAGPTLLVVVDLLRTTSYIELRVALSKLAFLFLAGGFVGLSELLRPVADRLGLVAACLGVGGAMTGSSLITAGFYEHSLRAADPAFAPVLEELDLYLTTVMQPWPGLFFPLGMLLFAVALFRLPGLSRLVPSLLLVAAVLFPVGRIPGWVPAVVACDVAMLFAMVPLGLRCFGLHRLGLGRAGAHGLIP